jgi:hypothetical protein
MTTSPTTASACSFLLVPNTFQAFLHHICPRYCIDIHILIPLIVAKPLGNQGKVGVHLFWQMRYGAVIT